MRLARVGAVVVCVMVALASVAPAAEARWPRPGRTTAVIDWQMPALTLDANGDGAVDPYRDGNRTADVPADGRYDVVLDGCGSANATRFVWTVGKKKVTTRRCATVVRLAEGRHHVTLTTRGPRGTAFRHGRISVVTHVVLGLGDSYGAGSGAAVPTDNPPTLGYHDAVCARTPRSHQALAALELEEGDPRSSVVFIHLACAGAQITPGMLSPFRGNRPQVDQARDLLNGQPADAVLLSIGGNDVGFSVFLQQCLLTPGIDCPLAPVPGLPTLHDYLMTQFELLRNGSGTDPLEGLPVLAACLGEVGCTTSETPDGSGAPLRVAAERVVYTTYPDLTRGDTGTYCEADPTSGDPGLANTTAQEWRWADQVLEALANEPTFTYTDGRGSQTVLQQPSPGLNAIIAETGARFGWSPVTGIHSGSAAHGYCAADVDPPTGSGRWVYRFAEPTVPELLLVPVHPNQVGHRFSAGEITKVLDPLLGG